MTRIHQWPTLFVPSVIAAAFVLGSRDHDRVLAVGAPVLGALWLVMLAAITVRWVQAVRAKRRDPAAPSSWVRLEVLTGAGRTMMWAGGLALVVSVLSGWASTSVLGVLGLGSVYLAVTWTALVAGSEAPWRKATIERTLAPTSASEGDAVREHVKMAGVTIPAGMRLFATGSALRHGTTTRYCVGSEASGGEIEFDSELGPAPRGEHQVPPLALWLGDVLGLARGPIVQRGPAQLTVLPKPFQVDGVRELLGAGGDDATSTPTQRMPTEGTFRIREYSTGDDTRRIHWVRSLQLDKLVVRLPDEIPPAEPNVRVVLDDHLWGAEWLTCVGADQLLDGLVRVWLGIGKSLAASGARVTMATAIGDGTSMPKLVERSMNARSPRDTLKLGARVRWQSIMPAAAMLADGGVRNIVVSSRPQYLLRKADVVWVLVPDAYWTTIEPSWRVGSAVTLPHPIGSGDNRLARRRSEQLRHETMWRDRQALTEMMWTGRHVPPGVYVARPAKGRVALEVAS